MLRNLYARVEMDYIEATESIFCIGPVLVMEIGIGTYFSLFFLGEFLGDV